MPLRPPPDEDDTADLEPIPQAIPEPPTPHALGGHEEELYEESQPFWAQRQVLIGCGCALLLFVCVCSSTVLVLDWYRQGELLYCGGLRPFFEFLFNIGPLEFDPIACPTAVGS